MMENPYRSASHELALAPNRAAVHWKQVAIALLISLIGGCALAVLWAVIGFCVYAALGSNADAFYRGPIAAALGWCVGLIPFVLGLLYLCRVIENSRVLNCMLVAILDALTSVPFIFLDDAPFDWTVLGYYTFQLVLAAAVGGVWDRTKA